MYVPKWYVYAAMIVLIAICGIPYLFIGMTGEMFMPKDEGERWLDVFRDYGVGGLLVITILAFGAHLEIIKKRKPFAILVGENLDAYIKDMQQQEEISTLKAHIASLENGEVLTNAPPCDGKGLPALVCRLRREGKSEKEIYDHLYGNEKWCSQVQIGALLHPDESKIAGESMRQAVLRA
jgi:hypothetical protein